ncbi:MAG: hypothetical protein UY39_C0037G0002 [Candidatus Kaiserbacteria bacterium GW2011_GWC2_49_12]|uniref:Fimbrial assembly family protein n=3 Tax=Candidatus Kaiseribacteriota TaxID=1752734 RepID=A0A0G1ZCY3_9BACT|nr:MAG: hypothetical protein UY39_C0037G0002 [Candidatus Kaiserbacteria bacterium GW2011_GWC2_49_12]KKW17059.1 MAG: hypothetical protein UY57_C0027G0005 [Candidatus Kaiserbacteria bacterium GW2011_GWB1_50_17]KKW17634.1 MAG: hypothetical protein UY59_C0034G0011 [Candidatus Kaiserbacteria bacterium GW2011_GWA1_50_28]HCM43795.1 hypothetical protein [Candidatus Kaiserbacteria bacterium]
MPEQQSSTSFIPRDGGQTNRIRRAETGGLLELMILVSIVLFVASGALGIGMFLYRQYLQASTASKVDQLERATAAFEPTLIKELTRLDDRMRAASDILERHIAPSALFGMLEKTTLQTITFRSLTLDAADPQKMSVKMEGAANSVNSIAHQADLFSKIGMINNPIFSDIDRQSDGVYFTLSALLNPGMLSYAALQRGLAPELPQVGSVPPSPSQQPPASPFEAPGTTEPSPDEPSPDDLSPDELSPDELSPDEMFLE